MDGIIQKKFMHGKKAFYLFECLLEIKVIETGDMKCEIDLR